VEGNTANSNNKSANEGSGMELDRKSLGVVEGTIDMNSIRRYLGKKSKGFSPASTLQKTPSSQPSIDFLATKQK
jgi:hypothetical protein